MKRLLCCAAFLFAFFISSSQDIYLMPDEFFITKGQEINLRLLTGDNFKSEQELKYHPTKAASFLLIDGGKKIDLKLASSDSIAPILNRKLENSGLSMVAMEQKASEATIPKLAFLKQLNTEGNVNLAEKLEQVEKPDYKEISSRFVKTLVMVDKGSGNAFNEKLDHDLEIILLQNPYKLQYGDDIIGQVFFKRKPLAKAGVSILTKGLNGTVFQTDYSTDVDGKIYFKLNRAGTWLVRLIHMLPSQDKSADYRSYRATYTFGFKGI